MTQERRLLLVGLLLPVTLSVGSVLAMNAYKFGMPLDFGYSHWEFSQDKFSGKPLIALAGFLIDPQRSLFLHFPVLLFALFGLPRFLRRHAAEYVCVLGMFGSYVLLVVNLTFWTGEWCYGPRLLIAAVIPLAVPSVSAFEWLVHGPKTVRKRRVVALVVLSAMLLLAVRAQLLVNRYDFFTYYRVKNLFDQACGPGCPRQQEIEDYFESRNLATINAALARHLDGTTRFPPLEMLEGVYGPDDLAVLERGIRRVVRGNLMWLPDARERLGDR